MDLRVDVAERGTVTVVTLAGDIDLHTAPELRKELEELREGSGPQAVVLDLSEVSFLDSSALGALVTAQREFVAAGGGLRMACPQPHAQKVFRITRLAEVIPIFDTVEAASG
jgi:anti-sigma B factor antagonist